MTNPVEKKLHEVAQSIEPSADFSQDLWKQIKMKNQNNHEPKRISRRFWIPAAVVMGLLLVLVISTPQTVLAVFKNLLSYIPGIGFVQTAESTLYLAEPVKVEQDGYSLVIDQVVADPDKVVVSYHIEGIAADVSACFYDGNQLQLSDGKIRLPIGGGVEGTTARVEFAALPAGVTEATLLASMDNPSESCAAPKEWKVSFALGTEVPAVEILPVAEPVSTQAASNLPESGSIAQISVDRVVELADGYLLTGHMVLSDPEWQNVVFDMDSITATDANGKSVAIEPTGESFGDNEFSLKVSGKDFSEPLTISVKDVWVWANVENAPSFSFDAGTGVQTGQSWKINNELTVASKKILIDSVQAVQDASHLNSPTTLYGYAISANSEAMNNVSFNCTGQDGPRSILGGTKPINGNGLLIENYYPDGLPEGQITCKFQAAQFKETGDWQFTWQPQ